MVKLYCCVVSQVWRWGGGGREVRPLALWITAGQLIWFLYRKEGSILRQDNHFREAEACAGFLRNVPHGKTQEKSSSPNKSLCDFSWVNGMSTLKGFFFCCFPMLQFNQIENNCVMIFFHLFMCLFILWLVLTRIKWWIINSNYCQVTNEPEAVLGFIITTVITLILND